MGEPVAQALEGRGNADPSAALALAILALARRGEQATAYRIARQPSSGIKLLQPALRSRDHERLVALATLCSAHELSEAERNVVLTMLAVGYALSGRTQHAEALAQKIAAAATPDHRTTLLNIVTDALAHHAGRHEVLLPLLTTLATAA